MENYFLFTNNDLLNISLGCQLLSCLILLLISLQLIRISASTQKINILLEYITNILLSDEPDSDSDDNKITNIYS